MSNQVFPALSGFDIRVSRAPVYSTLIQPGASGKELRASFQSYPRYRYTLNLNWVRQAGFSPRTASDEVATILQFFADHHGAWDSFLFTDPQESGVTAKQFGTGNGTTVVFQLVDGLGLPVTELNGTPSIYVNGVLKTTPADYSISAGLVTFTAAPAAAASLTWTGSYYRRVRFDGDELELERIVTGAWDGKSIRLISVK
jgi:uncharacterized protein (TIGR02217 family)